MRLSVRVCGVVCAWGVGALSLACGGDSGDGPSGAATSDGGVATADGRMPFVVDPTPRGPIPDAGPPQACEKMDLLFVVDDSGSMSEEQDNLATNFPRFIEVLDAFQTSAGAALDYRIGVTTTGTDFITIVTLPPLPLPIPIPFPTTIEYGDDDGPNGALLMNEDCSMTRRWIDRADPEVADTFSCVAQVGTNGSGTEMPLRAWNLAFTERVDDGTNEGFLRDDALLAVVILTDEDDCSQASDRREIDGTDAESAFQLADRCDPDSDTLIPVGDLIDTVDGIKGERGRWAVSVIAGPGPGGCSSELGDADEAFRLKEFIDLAGDNASFSSICEGDLSGALMTALETFNVACEAFPGPI